MAITYHAGRRIQALESDGTSSTTQGYDGGNGLSIGTTYGGGGGGGAGGAGTDCTSSTTGNGGIGFINNISGSTTGESSGGNYYLGGGGFGGTYAGNFGVDGLGAAFGGGGNGGYRQSGGGNGTTGVVILKLLTSASFSTSGSPASTTSGSHTILTYTGSTGSLIINSGTVDVQYLVLAGGGGAGGNNGFGGGNGSGGGGAGGILTGTLSLTADTYSVTVGTGGAGGSNSGTVGTNGVNSTFSTLTALGGGGGAPNSGNTYLQAATGGGSGGGGAGFTLAQNGTGGLAYVTVTDIRPTNVQVGSRYEETDTRKIYNYTAPATAPTTTSHFEGHGQQPSALSDTIDIPTTGLSNLATGSVSFWIYLETESTSNGDYVVISASNDTQASNEFALGFVGHVTGVGIISRNNGSGVCTFTCPSSLTRNAWNHVVYTNNSSGNKVYVNGSQVTPSYSVGSASTSAFFGTVGTNNTCTIGANKDNVSGGYYQWGFDGNLQQLLVYSAVLTQAEITALYNNGKYSEPSTTNLLRRYELTSNANDTSGNGHNGTATAGVTYTSLAIPEGSKEWQEIGT